MQKKRSVTIKDIARKFNCSPSTVSRALNNHQSINEHTRRNIQEYARKIQYQRNSISISLLNKKTMTVGVIVPRISSFLESMVINGIQSLLSPEGYTLNISLTKESVDLEIENVEKLLSARVDGFFVSVSQNTKDCSHFQKITNRGIPLIFIDRDSVGFETHKVLVDDYLGAYSAVEHLIKMGCTRIAHLKGLEGLSISDHRLNGYLDALNAYGIPVRNDYVVGAGLKTDRGVFPTKQLLTLKEPPDAIFAVNDNIAIGAMHTIRSAGFKIPDDIALVGFDNDPHSAFMWPPLSTVAQPGFELGREAARIFLNQVNPGRSSTQFEQIRLPSELLIRGSSMVHRKADLTP